MIKGAVSYVDGMTVGICTDEHTETTVGVDKVNTKVTIVPLGPDGKRGDAKTARKGYLSEVQNGDQVEARGSNPQRLAELVVYKGTKDEQKAARDFAARKASAAAPVQATVKAAGAPDAPKTVPAEQLTVPDEAPADVPHGQRRKWREEQAKKQNNAAKSEKPEAAAKK